MTTRRSSADSQGASCPLVESRSCGGAAPETDMTSVSRSGNPALRDTYRAKGYPTSYRPGDAPTASPGERPGTLADLASIPAMLRPSGDGLIGLPADLPVSGTVVGYVGPCDPSYLALADASAWGRDPTPAAPIGAASERGHAGHVPVDPTSGLIDRPVIRRAKGVAAPYSRKVAVADRSAPAPSGRAVDRGERATASALASWTARDVSSRRPDQNAGRRSDNRTAIGTRAQDAIHEDRFLDAIDRASIRAMVDNTMAREKAARADYARARASEDARKRAERSARKTKGDRR